MRVERPVSRLSDQSLGKTCLHRVAWWPGASQDRRDPSSYL